MFITFEGPEGSGKSTQAEQLKVYLEGKGQEVLLTREPGGTHLGKNLRELLLNPNNSLDAMTESFLFAADRSEHVNKVIKPALAEGKIVISDRYLDSTIAYQIGGRRLPEDFIRYLNMVATQGTWPDLTILLDVSSEEGLKRARKKGEADRFEKEQLEFHRRVRERYLLCAQEDPARFKIFDTAKKELEVIQKMIRSVVDEKLGN